MFKREKKIHVRIIIKSIEISYDLCATTPHTVSNTITIKRLNYELSLFYSVNKGIEMY